MMVHRLHADYIPTASEESARDKAGESDKREEPETSPSGFTRGSGRARRAEFHGELTADAG